VAGSRPGEALEASDDGQNFRLVNLSGGARPEHTISFPPVTAKYFRVTFKRVRRPSVADWAKDDDPFRLSQDRRPPPTMRLPSWCCIPERA
jgi:hypothetical protein